MALLTKEQVACAHRKWERTDVPNQMLRNEWHSRCVQCGVMDYDLEEHRRRVARLLETPDEEDDDEPEPAPKKRRTNHRTLHDIQKDMWKRERKKEQAKFREQCLKNPRWWLLLVPVIVVSLPILLAQSITWVFLQIATKCHAGTSWVADNMRWFTGWALRWTRAGVKKSDAEEV